MNTSVTPDELCERAWTLIANNQPAQALSQFLALIAIAPEHAEAWMMAGCLQAESGHYAAADDSLTRALTIDPTYADAYFNLAKVDQKLGRDTQALANCRKAVECDPAFVEAWEALLDMRDARGQWREALVDCEQMHAGCAEVGAAQTRRCEELAVRAQGLDRIASVAPLFIVGAPRSGTSMISGVFARCGAWMGEVAAGDASNPRGYYENKAMRNTVLKPMLVRQGSDSQGVLFFPELSALQPEAGLAERVHRLLLRQGYRPDLAPWCYKGCKILLVWPLWVEAFPSARWIIVRRPVQDIVASCLRTPFMRQHSGETEFWLAWAAQYERRIEALKASGAVWHEVNTQHIIEQGADPLESMIRELGLHWDAHSVAEFINPQQWKSG